MANREQLKILKKGVEAWNACREENRNLRPDLSGADLKGAFLTHADLMGADLIGTNLSGAYLTRPRSSTSAAC